MREGIQALAGKKESKGQWSGAKKGSRSLQAPMQVLNHMGSSVGTAQLTRSAPESAGAKELSKSVYALHSFSVSLFLCCFSPF